MDNKFEPKISPQNAIEGKVPEYSFEEGVNESVRRILDLLKKLNRDIFVVINGSTIQVGKTHLLGALQGKLLQMGIDTEPMVPFDYKQDPETKKVIFYTSQGEYISIDNANKRENISQEHPDFTMGEPEPADLYIGIYRSDKKFKLYDKAKVAADIMICNEHAKDRPL